MLDKLKYLLISLKYANCKSINILIPKFICINKLEDALSAADNIGYPVIVKLQIVNLVKALLKYGSLKK